MLRFTLRRAIADKKLLGWSRNIATMVLVCFAAMHVDIGHVIASMMKLQWWFVPSGLALFLLTVIVATMRWKLLLPEKPFVALLRSNIISVLYSVMLPSFIPSDASRVITTRDDGDSVARIAATVIIDRFFGLSAFMLVCAFVALLDAQIIGNLERVVIFSTTLGLVVAIIAARLKCVKQLGVRIASHIDRFSPAIGAKVRSVYHQVLAIIENVGNVSMIMRLLILSTIIQVLSSCSFILIGLAVNHHLSFQQALILATIGQLMALLPFSIGGIGIREVSLVAMMESFGIPREVATGALLAGYTNTMIVVLIGWILVSTGRPNRKYLS